jgi:amidase
VSCVQPVRFTFMIVLISSIRIPSSMCGIYGLRPSYCRLPYYGARNCLEGQESVMSVLGPMTNSLSGLKIFTKVSCRYFPFIGQTIILSIRQAIIDSRPWILDPMCIRKSWDQEAYELVEHGGRGGRKCFAMLCDDGLVKPHPPVFRAMDMMRKALEAAGHQGMYRFSLVIHVQLMSGQVIEWENRKHDDIFYNVVCTNLVHALGTAETTKGKTNIFGGWG